MLITLEIQYVRVRNFFLKNENCTFQDMAVSSKDGSLGGGGTRSLIGLCGNVCVCEIMPVALYSIIVFD